MNLTKDNITFNRAYRDDVTGFTGMATSLATSMEGEPRVCLEARKGDGTIVTEWFPVGRLSFVEGAV